MQRREFLAGTSMAAGGLAAGCFGLLETESVWSGAPLVEDRPEAVYLPASTEEMGSYGQASLEDGARAALFFTFPHRFWTVTGSQRSRVEVAESDTMHLMVSVWDPETGLVLPRQPRATVIDGGEPIERYQVWTMIAQRMGYHFGNNVELPGEGSYDVRVAFDPVGVRTAGALAGRFDTADSATFPIEFDSDDVTDLDVREIEQARRGERAASPPMQGMGPPVGQTPAADALPGQALGSGTTGDADLVARLLGAPPDGIDGTGPYLAVSLRTPYNRIALANASLAARVGGTALDLVETIDDRLGHHYGTVLAGEPAEGPTITVETPPQVARHDGYETAFFDMSPVTLSPPG